MTIDKESESVVTTSENNESLQTVAEDVATNPSETIDDVIAVDMEKLSSPDAEPISDDEETADTVALESDVEEDLSKEWEAIDRRNIDNFNHSISDAKKRSIGILVGMGALYAIVASMFVKANLPMIAILLAFVGVFFVFMTLNKSFKETFNEKPKEYTPDAKFLALLKSNETSEKTDSEFLKKEPITASDDLTVTDTDLTTVEHQEVDSDEHRAIS